MNESTFGKSRMPSVSDESQNDLINKRSSPETESSQDDLA